MPSALAKALQRFQGLIWGDGVRDDAVYFDGHTFIIDLIGQDANVAGILIRALSAANVPAVIFQINKDGSVVTGLANYGAVGEIVAAGGAASAGSGTTVPHTNHVHNIADATLTSRMSSLTESTQDVAASETSTSTSYTDLATAGPSVTLSPGVSMRHLLLYSAELSNSGATQTFASPSIAAASALDADSIRTTGTDVQRMSAHGLTAAVADGSVHKLTYRVSGGTGTWANRRMTGLAP